METRDQNARLSRKWPSILIALLALTLVALLLVRPRLATTANQPLEASLQSLPPLGSAEGYARATQPDSIEFPRDLGAHPDYQTEWWYYTGNLATADGRPFGYQLTIFRRALAPPDLVETEFLGGNSVSGSDWRTNQVYLAHFTISDPEGGAFYPTERFSRGGAGLAGATADPYHVWLEDWAITEIAPGQVRLHAKTDDVALDLVLTQTLPPVLHGDGGLSQKGPEPGNASYYYSIVQQQTAGTVRVGAETFDVTGRSWKDHEWSTSALPPEAVGWDWFSLELDNGGALMLFQIRREDGSLESTSAGSYITPDGQVQHLALGDWTLEVTDTWTSPTSGGEYPAGWRITVPAVGLELEGRPLLANQELNVSTVYWEGAVEFSGTLAGEPVGAQGYIEMTGYGGSMAGRL